MWLYIFISTQNFFSIFSPPNFGLFDVLFLFYVASLNTNVTIMTQLEKSFWLFSITLIIATFIASNFNHTNKNVENRGVQRRSSRVGLLVILSDFCKKNLIANCSISEKLSE